MTKIQNSKLGFTLIELLIVISITTVLTTMVVANFRRGQTAQAVKTGGFDLISKIREVQTLIHSGSLVDGVQTASGYELNFAIATPSTYTVKYSFGLGVTTTLETVTLPQNVVFSNFLVNGVSTNPVTVSIYPPFGKIYLNGNPNQNLSVELNHQQTGEKRSVILDGVSGRVGF